MAAGDTPAAPIRRDRLGARDDCPGSRSSYGVTVMVPTMFGWILQWYVYVPAVESIIE